ncbi:MAG: TraR/DksA family transcriptional regulator [Sandaracinaceae bacterium]
MASTRKGKKAAKGKAKRALAAKPKAAAKRSTAKPAAKKASKKASSKKAPAKKAPAKSAGAKKTSTKKAPAAKSGSAKKTSTKKAPVQKTAAKKAPVKKAAEKKAADAKAPAKSATADSPVPAKKAPAPAKKAPAPAKKAPAPAEPTSAKAKGAAAVTKPPKAAKEKKAKKDLDEMPLPTHVGPRDYAAHPDADLTLGQLDLLYNKLVDERARKVAELERHMEEALGEAGVMPDETDMAQRHTEQAYLIRFADKERKLLNEIERALNKMRRGEYGVCEGTEEPIGFKRLELRPWTRYSVAYKEQIERERSQHRR